MNVQELLTAQMDFASIGKLLRRGFAWWIDELAAMLPAAWRDRLSSRPRAWVEPLAGGGWRFWSGAGLVETEAPPSRRAKVGVIAPAGMVLLREVSMPPLPAADLRRMLALDIDRLSPLNPEMIHFDMEVGERKDGATGRRVLLGILARADAALIVAETRAAGYAPAALAVRVGDAPPRFDFLPQAKAAAGEPNASRAATYWLVAAILLVVANVGVLVGRDAADVGRMRAAIKSQQPGVDAVLRLSRTVQAEDLRRRTLIAHGLSSEPLRVLDILTQVVPKGAWVQHLERNGEALRLVGYKRDEIDMSAVLRGSAAFTNPRALSMAPTVGPTPVKPFDITVDVRPLSHP